MRWYEALATALVPLLLRLLVWTWSVRLLNRKVFDSLIRPGRPVVAATWHQMILPGVAFFRDRQAVIMVSRSRDGELIARVNLRMGFRNVRGSSSRGGREALQELVDLVKAGGQAAIMVDGPRGPAHEPKAGGVIAASRTGAPLVPIGCSASPAIRARSWDRTLIPLPFARVVVSLGEPMEIPAGLSTEEVEAWRLKLRDGLRAAEARAEAVLRT